uniref:Uncharacterized protein n=1 Tax=Panagrolaimus sp. JU765 TaxID=591449 RepID=A0AC34QVC6_9BILA
MYPLREEACLFEIVRITGLMDGPNVFAEIRSRKEVEHDCSYSDPVERSSVIRENLPKINFLNSDFVLKRRFYEICFPVIRRKLWLSSKKTGNLGKKPTTYLAKFIGLNHGDEDYDMNISTFDSIVFETKGCAGFADATSEDEVYFKNTNICFSTILELLPNLNWITYCDKLDDGWENELWSRLDQLKFVSIYPTKVTNFKILADLCRNGMEIQIDYYNNGVEFDMDELKEYFQTPGTILDDFPKPLFSIGRVLYYLKDPKIIELKNN